MKKLAKRIGAAVIAATMLTGLATTAMAEEGKHEHVFNEGICECGKYEEAFITRIPIKDKLIKECDEKGTLETITYTTPAWGIDESIEIEKVLQVYLPYGYDESQQYNVLYLQHGGGESEYYWLNDEPVYEGTKAMGKTTKALIDNMVKDGKMEPTIFVCPTPNINIDIELEEGESAGSKYVYTDEIRNVIVPLIETKYSTFANGDVSPENLKATRGHRGFAGFSMGAGITINVMMNCFDIFSYFGPWSGGSADFEEFKAALNSFGEDLEVGYMFNGNGTSDFALEGHDAFAHQLIKDWPEKFQDGKNFAWICFKGGSHAYNCWIVELYNSMLVFFK